MTGVLDLEKRLVYQVLDTLGIRVDAPLRVAIGGPPTRSFRAFLAFSRGVELEDGGALDGAASAYHEALALDPWFLLAKERLETVRQAEGVTGNMEDQIMSWVNQPSAPADEVHHSTDALGFGPAVDPGAGVAPLASPAHLGARPITITISWR